MSDAQEHLMEASAKKIIEVDFSGNVKDANDIRFDPDDNTPAYIGTHKTADALTSDTGWLIYKFTYSGSSITRIQKKTGAWDNRISLFA